MTMTHTEPKTHRLERSSNDRIAAGVCGGLGEHLGIDPVIFRVLIATSAFFGVGLLIYAIAWVVIPEPGAVSVLDRVIAELRRRKIPLWLAAIVVGLFVWIIGIPFHSGYVSIPVIATAVFLFLLFKRKQRRVGAVAPTALAVPEKTDQPESTRSALRSWISEATTAARERSRRRRPMYLATVAILVLATSIVATVDAITRVPLTSYAWVIGAVVIVALLAGAALRRTPIALAVLFVPVVASLFAFGDTRASLHDGSGDRAVTAEQAYGTHRQAFGRLEVTLPESAPAGTVRIDQAAGRVVLRVPQTTNAVVLVHIRAGQLTDVNGSEVRAGCNFTREVLVGTRTPDAVRVDIQVGAGQVSIQRA